MGKTPKTAPEVEGVYIEGGSDDSHTYKYVVRHIRQISSDPQSGDLFWVFEDGVRLAQVIFAFEELRVLPGGVLNERQRRGAITCIDQYLSERG